jgi:hypothetical protein
MRPAAGAAAAAAMRVLYEIYLHGHSEGTTLLLLLML